MTKKIPENTGSLSLLDSLKVSNKDKKTLKRINKLIKDIQRDPFSGIGKPEPLKYDYQGAWSRRIDAENRLIYMMDGDSIAFLSFKDHY